MSKPRIIVTINDGLVDVYSDGIDLSGVDLMIVDFDTDGALPEDLVSFGTDRAFLSVGAAEPADDEMSRDARRAYDTWALT